MSDERWNRKQHRHVSQLSSVWMFADKKTVKSSHWDGCSPGEASQLSYLRSGGWRAASLDWCLRRCTGSELYLARMSDSVVGRAPPFSHWGDTFLVTKVPNQRAQKCKGSSKMLSSEKKPKKCDRLRKTLTSCSCTNLKSCRRRGDPSVLRKKLDNWKGEENRRSFINQCEWIKHFQPSLVLVNLQFQSWTLKLGFRIFSRYN